MPKTPYTLADVRLGFEPLTNHLVIKDKRGYWLGLLVHGRVIGHKSPAWQAPWNADSTAMAAGAIAISPSTDLKVAIQRVLDQLNAGEYEGLPPEVQAEPVHPAGDAPTIARLAASTPMGTACTECGSTITATQDADGNT